jgi:hypothetical protein
MDVKPFGRKRRGRSSHCVRTRAVSLGVLLALACVLAACGLQPASGGTQQHEGTLMGTVVAGPTCPVERAENPCPPKPVPNREVRIETTGGTLAATVTTDGQGRFTVALAPGSYVVRVTMAPGLIGMRQTQVPRVQIVAGQTVHVQIELDTGIR